MDNIKGNRVQGTRPNVTRLPDFVDAPKETCMTWKLYTDIKQGSKVLWTNGIPSRGLKDYA